MGEPSTDLAVIASRYQTVNTVFTFDGSPTQMILRGDPKRWYVKFTNMTITNPVVFPYPGPPVDTAAFFSAPFVSAEYKYRDCPSVVTGEWYAAGGALVSVLITECLYLE